MINKKILMFILLFIFSAVAVSAAYPVTWEVRGNVGDFTTQIYRCTDATCGAYITGTPYATDYGNPNTISIPSSFGRYLAEFDLKTCYNPYGYRYTLSSNPVSHEIFNRNFYQLQNCVSNINTVTHDASATPVVNVPITFNVNIESAYTNVNVGPNTIPNGIRNWFSSDINAYLYVNGQKLNTKFYDVFMDSNQNLQFTWTPTAEGNYSIEIRTEVIDCTCASNITDSWYYSITVGNQPPSNPTSVILSPTTGYVGDTFTCTASGSIDPEADPITYYYEFFDNFGTPLQSYSTTNTYVCSGPNCAPSDTIYCDAKAYDGNTFSGETRSNPATILNRPPSVPLNVTLTPTTGYTGTDFTCYATGSNDPDGQSVSYYYEFYDLSGSQLQTYSTDNTYTCTGPNCAPSDTIYCDAKAYDGNSYSPEKQSNPASILNTPPTMPLNVLLSPISGYVGDTFTCTASGSTDADGDSISYYYEFRSGSTGVQLQNYSTTNTYTCAAPGCIAGNIIYCQAKAYDGSLYSTEKPSNIAFILNHAPVAMDDEYQGIEDTPLVVFSTEGVLVNDTDADLNTLTALAYSTTSHGTLSLNNNGSFVYTPNLNFYGIDTFSYKAFDGTDLSNTATVTITIARGNDAPIAVDDRYMTMEDAQLIVTTSSSILNNDIDPENDELNVTLVSITTNGTLSLNIDGSFNYTPNSNYFGTDSFAYMATDGALFSNFATVYINITSHNDAPVAIDDEYSTTENTPLIVNAVQGVLVNDTDVENNTLFALPAGNPTNGSVTLATDGSFLYTPNTNFHGIDTFNYRVYDGISLGNIATVTITVVDRNYAPHARDDTYYTTENIAIVRDALTGVLANDTDSDNDVLSAALVITASSGTVNLSSDGSFVYVPNTGFSGVDSFRYVAMDAHAASNITTANIIVNGANVAPVANNVGVNTTLNTPVPFVLDCSDADNDTISYNIVSGPAHGGLSGTAPNLQYIPIAGYVGADTIVYNCNDASLTSNNATVSVNVINPNHAAIVRNDSYIVTEDAVLTVLVSQGVLVNDSDLDNDTLSVSVYSTTSNGALTLNPDGAFVYTPNPNFNGFDEFKYRAHDGTVLSGIANVTITVNGSNDPPENNNTIPDVSYLEDTHDDTLDLDNYFVDPEGDNLTYTYVCNDTVNHIVNISADGVVNFTALLNYNGYATCNFTAYDGSLYSNVSNNMQVRVIPVNDAPVAQDDYYNTPEDTTLYVLARGILVNDSDVDSPVITPLVSSNPAHGSVSVNSNGSIIYVPHTNYAGIDSFTYRAYDGLAYSNIATVYINVNGTNDRPVLNGTIPNVTYAEDTYHDTLDLDNYFIDPDGDNLTYTYTCNDTVNHIVNIYADGVVNFTALPNYNGYATCDFTAYDGILSSAASTMQVYVYPVNDPPVALNDSATVGYSGGSVMINVLSNDFDLEDIVPGIDTITVVPLKGYVTLQGGQLNYTSFAGQIGADRFVYRVKDTDGATATATVTINIVNGTAYWDVLADQSILWNSIDGTMVYNNIVGACHDPDDSEVVTITGHDSNYNLSMSGNDLIVQDLVTDYYDSGKLVSVSCNGVGSNFTLTVVRNASLFITTTPPVSVIQIPENNAPIPSFNYDVDAFYNGVGTPIWSLSQMPLGMNIAWDTGLITWAITENDVGVHHVTVNVTDGNLSDEQSFVITVKAPPVVKYPREKVYINTLKINNDVVCPGNDLHLYVAFENMGNYDMKSARVTATILNMDYGNVGNSGVLRRSDTMRDVGPSDIATAELNLEIPDEAEYGYYLVKVTITDGNIRRVKYREIEVVPCSDLECGVNTCPYI